MSFADVSVIADAQPAADELTLEHAAAHDLLGAVVADESQSSDGGQHAQAQSHTQQDAETCAMVHAMVQDAMTAAVAVETERLQRAQSAAKREQSCTATRTLTQRAFAAALAHNAERVCKLQQAGHTSVQSRAPQACSASAPVVAAKGDTPVQIAHHRQAQLEAEEAADAQVPCDMLSSTNQSALLADVDRAKQAMAAQRAQDEFEAQTAAHAVAQGAIAEAIAADKHCMHVSRQTEALRQAQLTAQAQRLAHTITKHALDNAVAAYAQRLCLEQPPESAQQAQEAAIARASADSAASEAHNQVCSHGCTRALAHVCNGHGSSVHQCISTFGSYDSGLLNLLHVAPERTGYMSLAGTKQERPLCKCSARCAFTSIQFRAARRLTCSCSGVLVLMHAWHHSWSRDHAQLLP